MRPSRPAPVTYAEIRIIGGEWRGRKIRFPTVEGLRPTPDRVRETLFNWLMADIAGSRCLDLFAGSGALGLEALSRGATHVDFVDQAMAATTSLRDSLSLLHGTERAGVHTASAANFLTRPPNQPYDICFLDPPFRKHYLEQVIEVLARPGWLATGGHVYLEAGREEQVNVPAHWQERRAKEAGQVRYTLYDVADPA